ncbi:Fe2+-dependent dioxygenase [Crenobacter cavernae]|uniref:Fe2+-dependent dioxygenase n=1 Tax=Crenobacter cavernae TaxID=2290923 RepID=A0A345Y567_9NEIS|nr:Fe2+-dependent dioxygenase [Crenobacter cavernae]AXK39069.1 Fe2+-dependent dioxygenase [Crenobacter cavernae]
MLLHIPDVLTPEELARGRALLEKAQWADGRITAGSQSAQVKRNRQLPQDAPESQELAKMVDAAVRRSGLFFSAALPKTIFPPLFNRYQGGMDFGNHVDNAVRADPFTGAWVRTDVSCTLFFTGPDEYDGGELVVEDSYGLHKVKLPAGDMVLYPSTSLHRVAPVTQGARVASFFWVQSMVRDDGKRSLLFDMDMAIASLRDKHGDTEELIALTATYHNLLRQWAEV